MTGRIESLKTYFLLVILVAATLTVALCPALRHDARPTVTHIQWRVLSQWSAGLKRVAYCSEQAASFRGWQADLGPLAILHLEPTSTPRQLVQPRRASHLAEMRPEDHWRWAFSRTFALASQQTHETSKGQPASWWAIEGSEIR